MPEQKGRAGLEPETPKSPSDLKQKKKVAGNWPKRKTSWLAAPKHFSQRLFGQQLFLGRDSIAQVFAPICIRAERAGPPMAMPRLTCGKRCSAHGHGRFQFRMVFAGNGPQWRCPRAPPPFESPCHLFAFPLSEVGLAICFSKHLCDIWSIAEWT
jgi:hypothetical protein